MNPTISYRHFIV